MASKWIIGPSGKWAVKGNWQVADAQGDCEPCCGELPDCVEFESEPNFGFPLTVQSGRWSPWIGFNLGDDPIHVQFGFNVDQDPTTLLFGKDLLNWFFKIDIAGGNATITLGKGNDGPPNDNLYWDVNESTSIVPVSNQIDLLIKKDINTPPRDRFVSLHHLYINGTFCFSFDLLGEEGQSFIWPFGDADDVGIFAGALSFYVQQGQVTINKRYQGLVSSEQNSQCPPYGPATCDPQLFEAGQIQLNVSNLFDLGIYAPGWVDNPGTAAPEGEGSWIIDNPLAHSTLTWFGQQPIGEGLSYAGVCWGAFDTGGLTRGGAFGFQRYLTSRRLTMDFVFQIRKQYGARFGYYTCSNIHSIYYATDAAGLGFPDLTQETVNAGGKPTIDVAKRPEPATYDFGTVYMVTDVFDGLGAAPLSVFKGNVTLTRI